MRVRGIRILLAAALLLAGAALLDFRGAGRRFWYPSYVSMTGPRTLAGVLAEIGPRRRPALRQLFLAAGVRYPPPSAVLLAFKEERVLELWAPSDAAPALVRSYPVLAASGDPGPKLREGDLQVPEGVYRLAALNPNSSYHLSIRVDYPNAFDRAQARRDQRSRLGGDIYIHGKAVSIGCLAMGDANIEELFLLAADTGLPRMGLVIAPNRAVRGGPGLPSWTEELYRAVRAEVARITGGPGGGAASPRP